MKYKTHVLVIGAGVSGLTTAICLREKGFEVTIVAEKFSPKLVSNVAGALWEWPPAACGKHGTPRSLERSKVWCMTAYKKFKALHTKYGSDATGIYLRNVTFYFREIIENLPVDLKKMNELKEQTDGFQRGLSIIPSGVNLTYQKEIKDAYQHMAPTVDTDVYMNWLLHQVEALDCKVITEKINGNLIEQEQLLLDRFHCDAIVNCTGLGSIETTNDPTMYPLRGALVRVTDKQGLINDSHCIAHDENSTGEQNIIFIVPRGKNNTVILGGMVQQHQWKESLGIEDPIIRQMYDRCLQFLPELKSLPLDNQEPVRTGLRPFTKTNVCVENVPGTRLFYNYGHGGAGFTLSWGCAQEITERIQTMFSSEKIPFTAPRKLLENRKPTVFLLQDNLQIRFDLSTPHRLQHNLVILCSRKGLSKINPAHFEHIDQVRLLENYDLPHLLTAFNQIKDKFTLELKDCRIITNDEFSVLLAAQMRDKLGISGDKPEQILPFVNKAALKQALEDSTIRTPNSVNFSPEEYQVATEEYLVNLTTTLSFPLFAKPIIGAGSEKTTRIYDIKELANWCNRHHNQQEQFELSELIQGTLYNTSVVIIDGKITYFAPCNHFRPNDAFLHGEPIGNLIVREQDPEYSTLLEFSKDVLNQLPSGYPPNGVINLDFFIDEQTNQPVLLEIAARAPGGFVSKMFDDYQGVALSEWHLKLQMGFSDKPTIKAKKNQSYTAYCIHPRQTGTVTEIEKPVFNSQAELFWQICPGQKTTRAESIRDVALGIFLSNDNWENLKRDYELAHSQAYFKVNGF